MTGPLWTGDDALRAAGARLVGALPAAIGGVSIDTRTLEPGDLFCAIRGEARDGHDFVAGALARGAAAALVSEARAAEFAGLGTLFVVPDALGGLENLGRAARARVDARVVAVTGSVGKTGSKEMLRAGLAALGPTHASVASYNNQWGVPLTLARMPRTSRHGVFEIGMNHPGEILPLVAMVRPQVALVTTIAPVHLEFFASTFAIADAKGEIFSGLESGGTAVINADIAESGRLAAHAMASPAGRILRFGRTAEADIRLVGAELGPDGSRVTASLFGRPLAYSLASPGEHVVLNSLGVIAALFALGVDLEPAIDAIGRIGPPSGRGARETLHHPAGAFTLVDESYNGNPASMRAALVNLGRARPAPGGRRIAVLGDMRELGDAAPALHRGLAEAVEASDADLVFACGPHMAELWRLLPPRRRGAYAPSSAELEAAVLAAVRPGDLVMVKGSLGTRMGPIVKALRARFAEPTPHAA